jgi:hypothetical protein
MTQSNTTLNLECGYSHPRWNGTKSFRIMSFTEFVECSRCGHIEVIDLRGKVRTVKVNGSIKLWKRKPSDAKLPYKYGMYEFGYIEYHDGEHSSGPIPVTPV